MVNTNSRYTGQHHHPIKVKISRSGLCLISACSRFIEFTAIYYFLRRLKSVKGENGIPISLRNFHTKYGKIILVGMSVVAILLKPFHIFNGYDMMALIFIHRRTCHMG